jgi:hypothetical protein
MHSRVWIGTWGPIRLISSGGSAFSKLSVCAFQVLSDDADEALRGGIRLLNLPFRLECTQGFRPRPNQPRRNRSNTMQGNQSQHGLGSFQSPPPAVLPVLAAGITRQESARRTTRTRPNKFLKTVLFSTTLYPLCALCGCAKNASLGEEFPLTVENICLANINPPPDGRAAAGEPPNAPPSRMRQTVAQPPALDRRAQSR